MSYGKNLSAQALGRTVYILATTLVYLIVARRLGPSALGTYAFAVNIINIAAMLADFGTTAVLSRDLIANEDGATSYLTNFILARALLGYVVALATAIAVMLFVTPELRGILLTSCGLLPLIAARFFDPIFQTAGKPWQAALLPILGSTLLVCLTAAALLLSSAPIQDVVLAYSVAGASYGLLGLVLISRLLRPKLSAWSSARIGTILISLGPVGVSSIFSMLSTRVDILILADLRSPEELGQYSAAFRFLDLGAAVAVTVFTPLLPVFTRIGLGDRTALTTAFHSMMQPVATIVIFMAVVCPVVSPTFIHLLYGSGYDQAAGALDLLAWKFAIMFISVIAFALVMSVRSINYAYWATACALVVNIAANLILIPALGIRGAALAGVISEIPMAVANLSFAAMSVSRSLDASWWSRLALAGLAALVVVHLPLPGPRLGFGVLGGMVYLVLLRHMRALPVNPLPALRVAQGQSEFMLERARSPVA